MQYMTCMAWTESASVSGSRHCAQPTASPAAATPSCQLPLQPQKGASSSQAMTAAVMEEGAEGLEEEQVVAAGLGADTGVLWTVSAPQDAACSPPPPPLCRKRRLPSQPRSCHPAKSLMPAAWRTELVARSTACGGRRAASPSRRAQHRRLTAVTKVATPTQLAWGRRAPGTASMGCAAFRHSHHA